VNHVSLFKNYGDVAVCVRRTVILQRELGVFVAKAVRVRETVVGRAYAGAGGKV
jgi:hypothetical protein